MRTTLLIVTLLTMGIPPPAGGDILMTLTATSGTIGERQDVPFGSVSGDHFTIGGIFHSFGAAMPLFPLANGPRPVLGQPFDQSGPFMLEAELSVEGQGTNAAGGTLTIIAAPALVVQTSPGWAYRTSSFTLSGLVTTEGFCYSCVPSLPRGQQYALQGQAR